MVTGRKQIAWFSDASGEYRLLIGGQDGLEQAREIVPPPMVKFGYPPAWAPDGSPSPS